MLQNTLHGAVQSTAMGLGIGKAVHFGTGAIARITERVHPPPEAHFRGNDVLSQIGEPHERLAELRALQQTTPGLDTRTYYEAKQAQAIEASRASAVLAPFARLHADYHALAVDRLRRQADCLGDPQSSRIANGQDDPVLRILDCNEKLVDLFLAPNDRKLLRFAAGGNHVIDVPVPPQGDSVEKADRRATAIRIEMDERRLSWVR